MQSQIFTYVLLAGLAIALLWLIVTDLKSRTISNHLTPTVAAGALLYWLAIGLSLWPGIAWQLGLATPLRRLPCAVRHAPDGRRRREAADRASSVGPAFAISMLVVAMAMLGWVLTMGIWGMARSRIRRPSRHIRATRSS